MILGLLEKTTLRISVVFSDNILNNYVKTDNIISSNYILFLRNRLFLKINSK